MDKTQADRPIALWRIEKPGFAAPGVSSGDELRWDWLLQPRRILEAVTAGALKPIKEVAWMKEVAQAA